MVVYESLSLVVHCRCHHGAVCDYVARRHSGGHANAGLRVGTQIGRTADDDLGGRAARRLYRIDFGSYQKIVVSRSHIIVK